MHIRFIPDLNFALYTLIQTWQKVNLHVPNKVENIFKKSVDSDPDSSHVPILNPVKLKISMDLFEGQD